MKQDGWWDGNSVGFGHLKIIGKEMAKADGCRACARGKGRCLRRLRHLHRVVSSALQRHEDGGQLATVASVIPQFPL